MSTSYPAVGDGGLTADQWGKIFGDRDGIIGDYLGTAFSMTLLNATDEAQFSAAYVSVNGYVLEVSDGDKVSLPAPTSGSKTYYIGVLYDPELNVPVLNTDPPEADLNGPCRLMAYDTTIDTSDGKRFLILWVVTRTSAALTGATKQDRRRWVGAALEYADGVGSDAYPGNEGNYPRGSIRIGTNRVLYRGLNATGTALAWMDPYNQGSFDFPLASGLIARKNASTPPIYDIFSGKMVQLAGEVQRSSGNLSTGSTVTLGTMPVGARPSGVRSFICKVDGDYNYTEVRVNTTGTTDGKVLMSDPGQTGVIWVDLSPISYRIGA